MSLLLFSLIKTEFPHFPTTLSAYMFASVTPLLELSVDGLPMFCQGLLLYFAKGNFDLLILPVSLLHYQHFLLFWIILFKGRKWHCYLSNHKITKLYNKTHWKSSLHVSNFSSFILFWVYSIRSPPTELPKTALYSQFHEWPPSSLLSCHLISQSEFDIVDHSFLLGILICLGMYDPHFLFFFLVFICWSFWWICQHFQDL